MSYAGSFFGGVGVLFLIYLKIEQAHSGFHKGDQSNGFCQWPSFQVVLKPVNKLNTQGQSYARLINKLAVSGDGRQQTPKAITIN